MRRDPAGGHRAWNIYHANHLSVHHSCRRTQSSSDLLAVLAAFIWALVIAPGVAQETNFSETAGAQLQARGQEILRRFVETNRYWLLAAPGTVSNYSYAFQVGAVPPTSVRVENPVETARSQRQGIIYCSLAQWLARNPGSVQIRGITEQNGQMVLDVAAGPLASEPTNSTGTVVVDEWPPQLARMGERSFAGQCGLGLDTTACAGWFAFESTGGTLTIETQRMVLLHTVSRFMGGQGAVEETFSDYTEIVPGHLAPLSVKVKNPPLALEMKFKVHPGGLWLFDRGYYQGQPVAFVNRVSINRPPLNVPALLELLAKAAVMKTKFRQAQAALFEDKDAGATRKTLGELEAQIRPAVAFLKGTDFEPRIEAGLSQLVKLQQMLEQGDIEGGQELFEQLSQTGFEFFSDLVAMAPAPTETAKLKTLRLEHVEVLYSGISEAYAKGIARTLMVARATALNQYHFDMPDTVHATVQAEYPRKPELFTDSVDHVTMNLPSEDWLERPSRGGWFAIYGLCHEVGHMAMYRLLPSGRASWLSADAGQGWAHFFGSRVTDVVYEQCGPELWPDPYDYRADGMKRLERQLAEPAGSQPAETETARHWKALAEIVGDTDIAPLFKSWGDAPIDAANPFPGILQTLTQHKQAGRLGSWWTNAAPALLEQGKHQRFLVPK